MVTTRSSGKKLASQIVKGSKRGAKSITKMEKKQVPKRVQFRSNLRGVIDFIGKLELNDEHKARIKECCPFWKIIKSIKKNRITIDSATKGDNEVAALLGTFNKITKTFDICGKSLKLTKDDVVRAFGVRGGTEKVYKSTEKCTDSKFYKNFNGISPIRTAHVSSALKVAVEEAGDAALDNVASLITLYLLTSLFAPTGGATLCWGYNKILSDATTMSNYDWAGYIYEKLALSIETNNQNKVNGCVMLIPFWIMENFQFTEPREPNAKLWCEKWDLRKLIELRKQGPITEVLNTQVSLMNISLTLGDGVNCNEVGDLQDWAVDLGSDGDAWEELSNLVAGKEVGENCTTEEENKILKENIKIRDSHIKALEKRNAVLKKKDQFWQKREECLLEEIKQKDLKISEAQRELLELQASLTATKNETVAVRKRLSIKSSEVKALEQDKEKLVDENTELVVQKYTQVSCGEKESSFAYDGKRLDFDEPDAAKNIGTEMIEGEQNCDNQGKSGTINSMVKRLKSKIRQEAHKKDSCHYYGEEAKGKATRKQNAMQERGGANVQCVDDDFVNSPKRKRVTKQSIIDCTRLKKLAHAKFVSDDQLLKMCAIEKGIGKVCVVICVRDYIGASVILEDLYMVLDGGLMKSNIINGHGQLLMMKYNTPVEPVVTIFDSNIWSYVKSMTNKRGDKHAYDRKLFIDDVYANAPRKGLYLFPITTNRGRVYNTPSNHWMLLVFDIENQVWYLYNSMKGSGEGRNNPYFKDAKLLTTYMERILRDDWRESNKEDMEQENMIAADNTQEHTYDVIEPPCPQQADNSTDCGTYVCYLMEKLAKGEKVPSDLAYEDMLKYKAILVERFMNMFDETRLKKSRND